MTKTELTGVGMFIFKYFIKDLLDNLITTLPIINTLVSNFTKILGLSKSIFILGRMRTKQTIH